MGYSIYDIANFFLAKESMTHKKLQKLCYYAQVIYAGKFNSRLVDDNFEAWDYGPVNRRLFFRYQGRYTIYKQNNENVSFDRDTTNILEATFKIYGQYSGDYLGRLTHQEEPWKNAYNNSYDKIISFNDLINDGRRIINSINK